MSKIIPRKVGNNGKIVKLGANSTFINPVLKIISNRLKKKKKTFIVTPNPEFLVFAQQNSWFKSILNKADIAIPDGVALFWAQEVIKGRNFLSRMMIGFWAGLKVIFTGWGRRRITGTDLMEKLCQLAAKNNWMVYFLGGKDDIGQKALIKLQEKYPGLKGWAEAGPKLELKLRDTSDGGRPSLRGHDSSEVSKWIEKINQRKPDLLFVAFGMGKQEKFIWDNWDNLNVKLAMGVGGAFDYLSGWVKRAPRWVQNLGFEWFYRLTKQPWRIRRQLTLGKFIFFSLACPEAIRPILSGIFGRLGN